MFSNRRRELPRKSNPPGGVGKKRWRGQSLVEFALLAPVFILILLGTLDLGHTFYRYESVVNAAREAARYCAINYKSTPNLTTVVAGELELSSLPSGSSVTSSPTCNSSLTQGSAVTVTVSVPVQAPFIGPILGHADGKITVNGSGTMMVEGKS